MHGKNQKSKSPPRVISFIASFMRLEAAGGIVLFIAALIAVLLDNSPFAHWYGQLINFNISFAHLTKPVVLWINEGLMTFFFFLVGLEIKRELVEGELNTLKKAMLPCLAAFGGVLGPAFIYFGFNQHHPIALQGWAIPTATDIAFALGVLSLLGRRVPSVMKVFLTVLAIVDDLFAICIIAIFYTKEMSFLFLFFAGICWILLLILNRRGISSFLPYGILGFILWLCVVESGIHATLAGIIVAFSYPLQSKTTSTDPHRLEKAIHPWVTFGVLPLFALANAGITLSHLSLAVFLSPIYLGIVCGLFFGKQIGIMLATFGAVYFGWAHLPPKITWRQIYGVSLICGVGFTMSLFIGSLAFTQHTIGEMSLIRVGVLSGSLLSGTLGYLFLRRRA